ncbi:MAG: ABC transporter permease [Candidatus Acidiferrales bacterium]
MKFRHLIFSNLGRKKIRAVLTLGSFAVALFLYGLLTVVDGAFNQYATIAGADRLIVISRISILQLLPISYRDRIARIPGVKAVTHHNWFGGVYQDPKNFFGQYAIDPENQRIVFPEFIIPDDQWKTFVGDRQGAIIGEGLVKRFGWKMGDRIPIQGTFYQGTWEFNVDGIYRGSRAGDDREQFWFQYDYIEERALDRQKGLAGWYTVKLNSPDDAVRVAKAIDDGFANSPYETKTDSEKAFAANWVKQFGNIRLLILSIGAVVFFTLLLVTGNTMAIAVRERTNELAVLKAVGYSDRFVLFLVLTESLLIAVVGGGLGLLVVKGFTLLGSPLPSILPFFYLEPSAIITGLALALGVGLVSGVLPAFSAMRLRVVDALRRV